MARCGALYGGVTRRAPLVLISTSVQEVLTKRQASTDVEEPNVERFVRGSRPRTRDLGRGRSRPACDGYRVAEASGDGRSTVTAVEWNPQFNVSVELTLTAANGTNYSVELAPPWWWAEQHFPTIHVNDTLK